MGRIRPNVHHPQTRMALPCSVRHPPFPWAMLTILSLTIYHTLLIMTSLSLYRASTIPPGTPNQRYARPRHVEPDSEEEADFRGISVAEWRRRRGEKPRDREGDDDLPLSAIKALERTSVIRAEGELEGNDGGAPYPPASPPPIRSEDRLLRRWCKECQGWKPPRCHHCRTCGVCVLKVRSILPFTHTPLILSRWIITVYGSTHASDAQTTRHSCFSSYTPRHSARSLPKRRGT